MTDRRTAPEEVAGVEGAASAAPGRRLRIAAHNGAPEWGGAEIATSRVLAGLQERGHHVLLFYNRDVVARGARGYGLQVRPVHLGGDIALHHAIRFAYELRRFRPDVLVVGTFRKLWLAGLAGRLAGVPVVARIGLSSDVPRNAKYRFAFRYLVDRVITNAHDLHDAYHRLLPDAPPPELETIYKGVAVPEVRQSRAVVREGLGVAAGAAVVGGVGRLVPQKRFDRLIRAFALLSANPERPGGGRSGAPPELVIVGDGPLRETLSALAAELGVAEHVHLTGHRDDIPSVMAALDLLVVSSDRESMANVMLEAMAVGLPVVSTPVSGAREALIDAVAGGVAGAEPAAGEAVTAGRVVDATIEALAAAMAELLADSAARDRLGGAGMHRVQTELSRDRMLDRWERALRRTAAMGEVE